MGGPGVIFSKGLLKQLKPKLRIVFNYFTVHWWAVVLTDFLVCSENWKKWLLWQIIDRPWRYWTRAMRLANNRHAMYQSIRCWSLLLLPRLQEDWQRKKYWSRLQQVNMNKTGDRVHHELADKSMTSFQSVRTTGLRPGLQLPSVLMHIICSICFWSIFIYSIWMNGMYMLHVHKVRIKSYTLRNQTKNGAI